MEFFDDMITFFKWRKHKKQADSTIEQDSTALQNSFEELGKIKGDSLAKKRKKREPEKNYTAEEFREIVRRIDEQRLKEAQEKQKQEEIDAINEFKRSTFQIENSKLVEQAEYRLKDKNEIERQIKLALLNSKKGMADNVSDDELRRLYKLYDWLRKTETTKFSAENVGFLEQKSASVGKYFYFDKFACVVTGPVDTDVMLDSFVCDHDGVDGSDRMACIPLDVYSFCKCIEHSSLRLVEKMAKGIKETGCCPTRYASYFGWGKKEKEIIENALVRRMREIMSVSDGLNHEDDGEKI